ncbi:MBL fold metallo-hydrolase [Clostridium rectalis]|uniref:MBL fold metallo-hydrolase n=1 Tax=Clostridium rectalis TaxID=2040295 RepID=UPI000F644A3D|nr:MBL fold metallo-hydrolase [Clostridium rectalis]
MKIKRIPVGVYAANCYIVFDENTSEGLIIDPGDESRILKKEVDTLGVKVKHIFITHGHMDHTGAVLDLKNILGAKVYINEKDENMIINRASMFGTLENCGTADIKLKDGDNFKVGSLKLECIETPGHTLGGMCFLIDNVLFTGDTLFQSSIGRTDFEGGDFDMIIKSIKEKLLVLPEGTIVLPGHGPETSIKYEKMYNPFL